MRDVPDLPQTLTRVSMETALLHLNLGPAGWRFWTRTAAPPHLHPSICREHRYLTSRGGGVQSPDQHSPSQVSLCTSAKARQEDRDEEKCEERPTALERERWKDDEDFGGEQYVSRRTPDFFTFISHQVVSPHPSIFPFQLLLLLLTQQLHQRYVSVPLTQKKYILFTLKH